MFSAQDDENDTEGHMKVADKAAVFSAQDDEDDTAGPGIDV